MCSGKLLGLVKYEGIVFVHTNLFTRDLGNTSSAPVKNKVI
jgi:hypothetical protein